MNLVDAAKSYAEQMSFLEEIQRGDHLNSCPASDTTGYPAPCTCGFSKRWEIAGQLMTIVTRDFRAQVSE